MTNTYDVVILGGGLAGLTLALSIKQKDTSISVAVLESRKGDASTAAHKVGESTVELGTYYLRDVLHLSEYLEENHLHKQGLRFYFSPQVKDEIAKRAEYGLRKKLYYPSHQIDRGIFENDLARMVKDLGVDIMSGTRATDVTLSDEGHTISYKNSTAEDQLTSKWVVDATGRAGILKRKENLYEENDHDVNAVWFRVEGDIDVAEWSDDVEWQNRIEEGIRRLGTIHFMGEGYWVWYIPLSSGNTSIGIVADPRFHAFTSIKTLDKAIQWLEQHEPLCAKNLADKRDQVLDFKILKNYSYNCQRFYSSEQWGVVGEAGAFLDPFYSPGTDFIALSNSWMLDLITREHRGEDVYMRSIVYNEVHVNLFKNWLPVYQDKYELFDNTQVMAVKLTWDFALYWAIPCVLFTNQGLTNMKVLKALFTVKNSFGNRFSELNRNVQQFYLDWGRRENKEISDVFIDPLSVSFMATLQKNLSVIDDSEEALIQRLESNLTLLEETAAEMFRVISHRLNNTPKDMQVNPYTMSLNQTETDLLDHSKAEGALAQNEAIAEALTPIWL